MKKAVISFGIWVLATVSYKAIAQPEPPKKEVKKEIIIKSGGEEMDMRVQIQDGEVLINGKPISEFSNDSFKLTVRDLYITDGTGNIAFNGKGFFNNKPTQRTFMGVSTEANTAGGLTVKSVVNNGPAEKSGLKENDVLTSFNGTELKSPQQLYDLVVAQKKGDKAKVAYKRDGKKKTATITLEEKVDETKSFVWSDKNENKRITILPPNPPMAPLAEWDGLGNNFVFRSTRPKLGLTIQDTENGDGVKVITVEEESAAYKSGAKADDLITEIDGVKVVNTDQAREALAKVKEKSSYEIKVVRNGAPLTIKITIPKKLKTVNL